MKVHMSMVFLLDHHYFLFYISREGLLKSNTCQPHQEEIQKKKSIQTSKHEGSFKRKEKSLFLLLFPWHTLCWSKSPKPQVYLFTICLSKDCSSQYVFKYSHGNQQPSAVLRLCGYNASFKDAIYQFIYPKYKKVGLHTLDNHFPWT